MVSNCRIANGLQSDNDLQNGMQLQVPNIVSNIHNNSDTFKPFDLHSVVGDTTPAPEYVPPAPP